jgi:hypothetical protein
MSANSNVKPSEIFPVLAVIPSQSIATASPATSGWIQVGGAGTQAVGRWLSLILNMASSSTATATVTAQQATSAAGANAKALTSPPTMAATPSTSVGSAAQFDLALDNVMDLNGGFDYVQFTVTTAGAALQCALEILQGPAAFES